MRRRAVALLATATFVALLGGGGGTLAGAATSQPTISVSTHSLVPGQKVLITGYGWPVGTALSATLCGADAVSGTVDCAQTATVSVVAPRTGRLYVWLTPELPPKPCPCVILVTGVTSYYSKTIPVTVAGAAVSPVPPTPTTVQPHLQIADLQVVGGMTLASSFGTSARRLVELQVHNAGPYSETPLLLGRWGTGTHPGNVLVMPIMGALRAGQSAEVHVPFSLPVLSIGRYTVRVEAEVVGFSRVASASASTSTWPIALFVLALVLLELIAFAITKVVRVRRRRKAGEGRDVSDQQPASHGSGERPEYENSLVALGAQVGQSEGGTLEWSTEVHDPNDQTWQLE